MTNEEMILKAREAKSPDELLKIAHGAGMTDFTEENARVYFNALNQSGEMSDGEIDASGGGLKYHDRIIITHLNSCHQFRCAKCGRNEEQVQMDWKYNTPSCSSNVFCCNCQYFSYDTIFWVCNNYDHNHDKP